MKYTVPIAGSYRITQKFGENLIEYKGIKGHNGFDYGVPIGTPIVAPEDGVVVETAEDKTGYGRHVWFMCENGEDIDLHVLAHLESINCTLGQRVNRGDILGYSGSTGYSTGPHLHWGIRKLKKITSNVKYQRTYLGQLYEIVDYENGYLGFYDFSQLVENMAENVLPVSLRYNQPISKPREAAWSLKYRESKVRELALKAGFGHKEWPLMKNAFVYGFWPREVVFDTSAFALWAYNTKPDFDEAMKTKNLSSLKAPIPPIFNS